jgi:hypothetical protein
MHLTSIRRCTPIKVGSACDPVIVSVFKTGGRQVLLSSVGSTPTRFRQLGLSDIAGDFASVRRHERELVMKG